jgi:hypothetical protein
MLTRLEAEKYILQILGFNVPVSNAVGFFRICGNNDENRLK